MKKQITQPKENIEMEGDTYGLTFRNTKQYKGYYHEKTVSMDIMNRDSFLDYVKEILKFIKEEHKKQKTQHQTYYSRVCYLYKLKNNQHGDFGYCTRKTSDYTVMLKMLTSNLKRLYETFNRYEYINIYRIEFVNREGN
jgi:hypothetical protein